MFYIILFCGSMSFIHVLTLILHFANHDCMCRSLTLMYIHHRNAVILYKNVCTHNNETVCTCMYILIMHTVFITRCTGEYIYWFYFSHSIMSTFMMELCVCSFFRVKSPVSGFYSPMEYEEERFCIFKQEWGRGMPKKLHIHMKKISWCYSQEDT